MDPDGVAEPRFWTVRAPYRRPKLSPPYRPQMATRAPDLVMASDGAGMAEPPVVDGGPVTAPPGRDSSIQSCPVSPVVPVVRRHSNLVDAHQVSVNDVAAWNF